MLGKIWFGIICLVVCCFLAVACVFFGVRAVYRFLTPMDPHELG